MCPWYFKGVVMHARHCFRYVVRAGVGAALLRLLRMCRAVLPWVTPGALGSVWIFNGRTGELPEKATSYLRCESRRMLLRTEGAFGVSVDRNYSSRAWHLELEICVAGRDSHFKTGLYRRLTLRFGNCPGIRRPRQVLLSLYSWLLHLV